MEWVLPGSFVGLFQASVSLGMCSQSRLCFILVRHATVWFIWKSRNNFRVSNSNLERGSSENTLDIIVLSMSGRWCQLSIGANSVQRGWQRWI